MHSRHLHLLDHVGEYNRDQWISFDAIRTACAGLPASEIEALRKSMQPYLDFRRSLDEFHSEYFCGFCQESCYQTHLSACCGFESIITFFADQVISWLLSSPEERAAIFHVLEQPNKTRNCVFLGREGCLWHVRPISCAMFFCEQAKAAVFGEKPEGEVLRRAFRRQEKDYTWPTKPVLFDTLEAYFLELGVESPHLYCHRSPGLLRLKARAGLVSKK